MKAYVVTEHWKIDTEILVYAETGAEAREQVKTGEKIGEYPEVTSTSRGKRAPEYDEMSTPPGK
jgi:hypothetical protein